jgi:Domain of unknown function (DUF4189)
MFVAVAILAIALAALGLVDQARAQGLCRASGFALSEVVRDVTQTLDVVSGVRCELPFSGAAGQTFNVTGGRNGRAEPTATGYAYQSNPGYVGADTFAVSFRSGADGRNYTITVLVNVVPDVASQPIAADVRTARGAGNFGALASSQSTNRWGLASRQPDAATAASEARAQCGQPDCEIRREFGPGECLALASGGRGSVWGTIRGGNAAPAVLRRCNDDFGTCQIVANSCGR